MQKKRIIYTTHALQRKLERNITDDEVSRVLNEPDYILSSIEGRKIAVKHLGNKIIRVIYKEEKTILIVITVTG